MIQKLTFDKTRPLSWSAISSFEYDPDQWFCKYVLKQEQPVSREMLWGKLVADSFGTKKPLAPVIRYPVIEQKLEASFGGMKLIGYMDTYWPGKKKMREYKTGKKPWTQDRADKHGQIDMYLLMLYLTEKIRPEDMTCHIDWIPTQDNGDFSISFVEPIKVYSFQTKRTTRDILLFGVRINSIVKEMETYTAMRLERMTALIPN